MTETETGESRDGKGAGDHDREFSFGAPLALLDWHDHWRLLVLKGRCMDGGPANGDTDWTEKRDSGLVVPVGPDLSKLWRDDASE